MADVWIRDGMEVKGPYPMRQVVAWLEEGRIARTASFSADRMKWMGVDEVFRLVGRLTGGPPPPAEAPPLPPAPPVAPPEPGRSTRYAPRSEGRARSGVVLLVLLGIAIFAAAAWFVLGR